MRKEPKIYHNLTIENAGSEGKCVARKEGKAIMVNQAVPGDVADVRIISKKRRFEIGIITNIITPSADRIDTFCRHYSVCGGCKWQQMSYEAQLKYKQQQVQDNFERIGKFDFPEILPIIGCENTTYYRNKLEYSFTNRKWLESIDKKDDMQEEDHWALGYHVPGRFDKIFGVVECFLQDNLQNEIRNKISDFCINKKYSFYDLYKKTGFLRNIILRNNLKGEWMLIFVFGENNHEDILDVLNFIKSEFPQIVSLLYTVNEKLNDTIYDQELKLFYGQDHIIEEIAGFKYKIGGKSFFQTNSRQTLNLYNKTLEFAGLTGNENVYDLYTGVGTIAIFLAQKAKSVVGIESVEDAIKDAYINASMNNITNTHFYAGDTLNVLNDELINKHGKPDVLITDPPRVGMHQKVVMKICEVKPKKIVYVSCNPATQARDIAWMIDHYEVKRVQPVDMFPHTHHVENIVELHLKNQE